MSNYLGQADGTVSVVGNETVISAPSGESGLEVDNEKVVSKKQLIVDAGDLGLEYKFAKDLTGASNGDVLKLNLAQKCLDFSADSAGIIAPGVQPSRVIPFWSDTPDTLTLQNSGIKFTPGFNNILQDLADIRFTPNVNLRRGTQTIFSTNGAVTAINDNGGNAGIEVGAMAVECKKPLTVNAGVALKDYTLPADWDGASNGDVLAINTATKQLEWTTPSGGGSNRWQSLQGLWWGGNPTSYGNSVNWNATSPGMRPSRLGCEPLSVTITHLVVNMNIYVGSSASPGNMTATFQIIKNPNGSIISENTLGTLLPEFSETWQPARYFQNRTFKKIDITALNLTLNQGEDLSLFPKFAGNLNACEFSCYFVGTHTGY